MQPSTNYLQELGSKLAQINPQNFSQDQISAALADYQASTATASYKQFQGYVVKAIVCRHR